MQNNDIITQWHNCSISLQQYHFNLCMNNNNNNYYYYYYTFSAGGGVIG